MVLEGVIKKLTIKEWLNLLQVLEKRESYGIGERAEKSNGWRVTC